MLTLLLVGSLAMSAPVPKDTRKPQPPPDVDRVLGAWDVYDSEKAVGTGTVPVWTFTGGMMLSNTGNTVWTVQLYPDQSPKQFTLQNNADRTFYSGIYEFDGDKLRIAYSVGRGSPADFDARPGVVLNVLVKAKVQPGK